MADTILVKIDELEVILGGQVETHLARENDKWKDKLQGDTNKYRNQKQYVVGSTSA